MIQCFNQKVRNIWDLKSLTRTKPTGKKKKQQYIETINNLMDSTLLNNTPSQYTKLDCTLQKQVTKTGLLGCPRKLGSNG